MSALATILIVGGDARARTEVVDELRATLPDEVVVVGEPRVATDAGEVDLVVLLDAEPPLEAYPAPLGAAGRRVPVLVVTRRTVVEDLAPAIDAGRVAAVVAAPWTTTSLRHEVPGQLARALAARSGDPAALRPLLDALAPRPIESPWLRALSTDAGTWSTNLVAALDDALGPRPRLLLPPGTRLTREGRTVGGLFVILDGAVALDRSSPVGDLQLHHSSTGPVIGLLALTQQQQAFFTARTTTPVTAIHLSVEQLDRALVADPRVAGALAAAMTRALAARLRRAEQQHVEQAQLNQALDHERRQLLTALRDLEAARLELVAAARYAILGELAAGVAHELNNAIAALERGAGTITSDLEALLAGHPRGEVLRAALDAGHAADPASAPAVRARRRTLATRLGPGPVTDRLARAGVGAEELDDWAPGASADDDDLPAVATAAELGASVRNLGVATSRIAELVDSLRSYARPPAAPDQDVEVRRTLDDALRLVSHRLEAVEVSRVERGRPAPVRGHPGELTQVWTNLLVNALDAIEDEGTITIEIASVLLETGEHVQVRITDDGPGVDPAMVPQLFEPRFTTRHGTVRYGLGLGLALARRLVEGHGGTITLEPAERGTAATVTLPIDGPGGSPCGQ